MNKLNFCNILTLAFLLMLSAGCNSKAPQTLKQQTNQDESNKPTRPQEQIKPTSPNNNTQPTARPTSPPKVENFTPDTCTLELATKCKDPAKCVGKNPEHFTPGCRKHIAAFLSLLNNTKTACQKDIILICNNNPDHFQAMRCLMQNRNALSKECLQTLPPMPL